jgi:hypothetical protein
MSTQEVTMKSSRLRRGVLLAAIVAIGTASNHLGRSATVQAQLAHRPPPLTAKRAGPVVNMATAIAQTAAVVEGSVADIQYDYTDEDGPWTTVMLSDVRAHFGESAPFVEIRHFGGPLPNGKMLVAAELPVFELKKRYVVFLRNTAWNLSPVVGDLAFSVESVGGAEALLNSDGQPVTEVGAAGIGLGPAILEDKLRSGIRPRALASGLQTLQSKSLDRRTFVASLRATMGTRLTVGGPFYDRPAGEFKWRAMPTARTGSGRTAGSLDLLGSRTSEKDTTEPSR